MRGISDKSLSNKDSLTYTRWNLYHFLDPLSSATTPIRFRLSRLENVACVVSGYPLSIFDGKHRVSAWKKSPLWESSLPLDFSINSEAVREIQHHYVVLQITVVTINP